MTEKKALLLALEYVQPKLGQNSFYEKAAHACFILAWLQEKGLDEEVAELLERVNATAQLNESFMKITADELAVNQICRAVGLMNHIFGWGLVAAEWNATEGTPLIDELWSIINKD
jgi:hypothetical protein